MDILKEGTRVRTKRKTERNILTKRAEEEEQKKKSDFIFIPSISSQTSLAKST